MHRGTLALRDVGTVRSGRARCHEGMVGVNAANRSATSVAAVNCNKIVETILIRISQGSGHKGPACELWGSKGCQLPPVMRCSGQQALQPSHLPPVVASIR